MAERQTLKFYGRGMTEGEWVLRYLILDLGRPVRCAIKNMGEVRVDFSKLTDEQLNDFIKTGQIPSME